MAFKTLSRNMLKNLTHREALSLLPTSYHIRYMNGTQIESQNAQWEEVSIPVPWGHISGKWWGPKDIRPIIGLHGWQDNAGTFDTLAPLLPQMVSFLSLDLPGHGLSSRIPDGMSYHLSDFLYIIKMIMHEYNWNKVSFLSHSMGSIITFLFSAIFPDKVDMVIGIDALKPHIRPVDKIIQSLGRRVDTFLIADERNREKSEPPCYTYDELIEKLHTGTFASIDKESCKYLLARNIQKSSKYPDKYFFTRDSRLKAYNLGTISQAVNLDLAKRIVAPHLFIKVLDTTYYEDKRYFDECIEVLKNNPKFEFHQVEGRHHVHLNEPTKVSGIINAFINKYRPAEEVSKL